MGGWQGSAPKGATPMPILVPPPDPSEATLRRNNERRGASRVGYASALPYVARPHPYTGVETHSESQSDAATLAIGTD